MTVGSTTGSTAKPLLAVIAVIFLWGCMASVLKHFTAELDAATMIGARFTLCGLFWLPTVLRAGVQGRIPRALAIAAIIPALVFLMGQITWSIAPYHNDASVMMFIGRMAFFFSMIFGFLILKGERVLLHQPGFWVGVLCTITGILVFCIASQGNGSSTAFGFFIMLLTTVFWGAHGVCIKRFLNDVPATLGFGLMSVYIMPAVLGIMFIAGEPSDLLTLSCGNWGLLVAASFISIAVGQALSFYAFQQLGPVVVEGGYQSVPFVSALVAFFWLGEEMSVLQWGAGCVVVAGSVLLLRQKCRPA